MNASSLRPDEQALIRNYRGSFDTDRAALLKLSGLCWRAAAHEPVGRPVPNNVVPLGRNQPKE